MKVKESIDRLDSFDPKYYAVKKNKKFLTV